MLQEKDNIITMMRRQSINPQLNDNRKDSIDFEFDDLLANYPMNKRMTEMPHINEKVLNEKYDDVYFKMEDYVLACDESSSRERNSNEMSNTLSPPKPIPLKMSKRMSITKNKLKEIAENPAFLLEKISSPERKSSDNSDSIYSKKNILKFYRF